MNQKKLPLVNIWGLVKHLGRRVFTEKSVCWCLFFNLIFFTDSTMGFMVNHHEKPPFGRNCESHRIAHPPSFFDFSGWFTP